MNRRYFRSSNC